MPGEGRKEEKQEIIRLRSHLLDRDDGVVHRRFKRPVWVEYSGVLGEHHFTMLKLLRRSCAVLGLAGCLITSSSAQQPAAQPADDYVRTHYTKYEYRIPMRDGKRLF